MKNHPSLLTVVLALLLGVAASAHDSYAPLSEARLLFLKRYEVVRAALAADDLAAARKGAEAIEKNEHAEKLTKAGTISEAREAFKKLSVRAVHLVVHQDGYFIANCPMVEGGGGEWVQLTGTVNNPFFGPSMLTCGAIKATSNAPAEEPAKK